jgi:hypothetical protein
MDQSATMAYLSMFVENACAAGTPVSTGGMGKTNGCHCQGWQMDRSLIGLVGGGGAVFRPAHILAQAKDQVQSRDGKLESDGWLC